MTRRLAQTLLQSGKISQGDLEDALQRQVLYGGSLGTNLLESGVLSEPDLIEALGTAHGLPTATKADVDIISPHIPRLFPQVFAESYHLVPFRLDADVLNVLVTGQPDRQLIDRIRERLVLGVKPYVTSEARLHYAMNHLYGAELLPRFKALLSKIDGSTMVIEPGAVRPATMLSWGVSSAHIELAPTPRPSTTRIKEMLARMEFATDRETIVEILMQAVRGIFDFVALFLVHGQSVNGWRATDLEATQRIAQISVGVELPSVFQTIYATRGHYLGPLPQNSANGALLEQMGRERPRAAFVAPLIIGDRLAMILYCDNGARGIPPRRVAAVLLITQRASVALERLIRRRKAVAARVLAPGAADAAWEEDIPIEFDLANDSPGDATEASEHDFEVLPESPVAPSKPIDMEQVRQGESWEEVSFSGVDESPDASRQAFERSVDRHGPTGPNADVDYVPFADVEDNAEESLEGWGDVLVETADTFAVPEASPARAARAVASSVTWDDVIKEALAAQKIQPKAAPPPRIEVAGTLLDQTEILWDGAEAHDPGVRRDAIEKLLKLGDAAYPALARRFPGHLSFDPFDARSRVPPFPKCSGLTEYLFARGTNAAAVVLPFLDHGDRIKRFIATYYLLAVRTPAALDALARRLYDPETRNRHLAADALRAYANEDGYERIVEAVRAQLRVPVLETQISAVQLLGQLRDPASVPELIPLVVAPEAELGRAATSALAVICTQEFGDDVPSWSEWWRLSYNRPRPVWLIQGLRHTSVHMRRIANYELQLLTGMTTHFDPEAPLDEREEKTRMWENWWLHFSRAQLRAAPPDAQAPAAS